MPDTQLRQIEIEIKPAEPAEDWQGRHMVSVRVSTLNGTACHSGTVPKPYEEDPIKLASEILLYAEMLCGGHGFGKCPVEIKVRTVHGMAEEWGKVYARIDSSELFKRAGELFQQVELVCGAEPD